VVRARLFLRSRLAAAPVVAVALVALAGCSATNEITTDRPYNPSDGVRTDIGDVRAENLFLLTAAKGDPGALQGALSNGGDESVQVKIGGEQDSDPTEVRVPAHDTVLLGADGEDVQLASAPAEPGATTPLTLTTAAGGSVTIQVPVLDGTLPEYATLVPTPAPSATVVEQNAG